jgi:N-acetylglucosamine kinase-like BadF-type ATPase
MSGPLVLGLDGGGSKTLVALADTTGAIVGAARGPGINPMDNPNWRRELGAVLATVGADRAAVTAAAFGLPAYGEVAAVARTQEAAVAELLGGGKADILNDVDLAQYGAFAGEPGILILSGSGSMAWAREGQGRCYRVGGWGEAIGDEGSAFWIGMRAIALVSQDIDGRARARGLTSALFAHLGLDPATPMDSLTGWVAGLAHRRSGVAALAELVAAQAAAGDADAMAILEAAAAELARHVTAIAAQVPGGATLPWSYAGGTFRSLLLLDAVARRIGRPPLPPRLPPIGGALLRAARRAGWAPNAGWIDRLAAAIADHPDFNPTTKRTSSTKQGEQGDAWKDSTLDDRVRGAADRGTRSG